MVRGTAPARLPGRTLSAFSAAPKTGLLAGGRGQAPLARPSPRASFRCCEDRLGEPHNSLEPQCPQAQPRRRCVAVSRFYQGISGYAGTGAGPNGRTLRPARARVYGELTPAGTRQLIRATRLGPGDVFVDLGSGVGKVVLQVALAVPGVRCIGIEIDGARHASACEALRRAEACGLLEPGRCVLHHGDIRQADLGNATVLFAHSTCFPAKMLGALARRIAAPGRPVTLVTTSLLSGRAAKLLAFAATRACQLSWDKHHRMHVYRCGVDG